VKIAVIGAGVVGTAIARKLAIRGAEVIIYEAQQPGYGTSGTSFAWINSHEKLPASYHALNVTGMGAHQEYARNYVGLPFYFRTGSLLWSDDPKDVSLISQRVSRLQETGYKCRWVSRSEVTALEPDVRLPSAITEAAFFPDEGFVYPIPFLATLLGEALDNGAELRCPARVCLIRNMPRGAEVILTDNSRDKVDLVVSCVGRWTSSLLSESGLLRLPLISTAERGSAALGYLGYTRAMPVRLSRVLMTSRINVRPDGGGRLIVQALDLDRSADPGSLPSVRSPIARELASRVSELFEVAGQDFLTEIRLGQRVLPGDGLTVAGRTEPESPIYVVATHSGITLSLLLGDLVAQEVIDEADSPLLCDFRPERSAMRTEVNVQAPSRSGEQ